VTKPPTEAPAFEKEVVRLPDGRELTYYRFPDDGSRPAATSPKPPAPGQER
jgi:hypothetical protein